MKTREIFGLICVACGLTSMRADLVNAGYEQGLAGWQVSASSSDGYYLRYPPNDDPPSPVVYPFDEVTNPTIRGLLRVVDSDSAAQPWQGSQMLRIMTSVAYFTWDFVGPDGNRYSWVNGDQTWITASQTLTLQAGDTVSGRAQWYTEDFFPTSDHLEVLVDNSAVLVLGKSDIPDFPLERRTGWREWSWTAPADGQYTVTLAAPGDGEGISIGFFDGLSVPEGFPAGGTTAILGIPVLALILFRQRIANQLV